MQVLHGHNHNLVQFPVVSRKASDFDSMSVMRNNSSSNHNIEVKEKRSSNTSLMMMNPVASGDNVSVTLASAHKLKVEAPPLIPCCEGKELQINEELVHRGLSAISVKHENLLQTHSLTKASDLLQISPGLIKHRNSFRCLHRPELKRVPYLRRMATDELESIFKEYAADRPVLQGGAKHAGTSCSEMPKPTKLKLPSGPVIVDSDKSAEYNKNSRVVPVENNMEEGNLNPIPESSAEDVPEGKRLRCVRARLYTSVLAGAKAGDQLENVLINEGEDRQIHLEDPIPEEEVQIREQLQIILPPKYDDIATESTPDLH